MLINKVAELTEEIQILRNELIRKDAIIEGLLSTLSKTAITTRVKPIASSAPLTDLCKLSKEVSSHFANFLPPQNTAVIDIHINTVQACDAVSPMLQAFYAKITDERHGGASKLKSDATYFTIADGTSELKSHATYLTAQTRPARRPLELKKRSKKSCLLCPPPPPLTTAALRAGIVQHMFIEHLFAGGKFAQIVGEEDESRINILTAPYTVDDLVVPEEFNPVIQAPRPGPPAPVLSVPRPTLARVRRLPAPDARAPPPSFGAGLRGWPAARRPLHRLPIDCLSTRLD